MFNSYFDITRGYSPIHIHSGSHWWCHGPRRAHGCATWFMLCANGTGGTPRGPALRRWSSSIRRPWTWGRGAWHGKIPVGNGKFPWEKCQKFMGSSLFMGKFQIFFRMFMGNSHGKVHMENLIGTMERSWESSWDFSIPVYIYIYLFNPKTKN